MSHDDPYEVRPTGREQGYPQEPTMDVAPETDPTMPFRVEPAIPVPDDAVNPDAGETQTLPAPQWESPVAPPPSTQPAWTQPASTFSQGAPGLVSVRTGPRPGTIVLGLLSLIVAALVLVRNLTGLQLDLAVNGPIIVAVIGGLLVVVGLFGVALGRRHHD